LISGIKIKSQAKHFQNLEKQQRQRYEERQQWQQYKEQEQRQLQEEDDILTNA
jgi:hypothetical protein